MNIRTAIWKIICRVDEVQQRCLEKYEHKRITLEKQVKAFEKKYKDYANPVFIEKKKKDEKFVKASQEYEESKEAY